MKKIWTVIKAFFGKLFCCKCAKEETTQFLTVEKTISADREYMYLHYKKDYQWFETCITLKDYLDEEPTSAVAGVGNIFQAVYEKEDGYSTKVVLFAHTGKESTVEEKDAFWVGDCVMNDSLISLTFEGAFNRLMATNCPKPHSKQCVLRRELGPKIINPQYIFGNIQDQVYVDAVTGKVSEKNPAYDD